MKFNVPSKEFYRTISAVGRVINSKNALQILDNFLITLKGDVLTISAMDVENFLSASITVQDPEGEGSFCLNAARLTGLFKEIPDQGVQIEINDNLEVHVRFGNGESDFVALPGIEYPNYEKSQEEGDTPVEFEALASQFIDGIENTIFATSDDDYRVAMMGIYTEIKPDGITFVATDTRKMVRYCDNRHRPGVTASCILPTKPANILRSVFGGEELIKVSMTTRSAEFSNGVFTFNCRFILGNFPDYNRVIPKNNNFLLTVDRSLFASTIRRVGLACDKGYNLEKFKIMPDKMIIKADDPNLLTRGREEIPCSFTGEELVIGFGESQLTEVLGVIRSNDVNIRLGDASRPGIFEPTENIADTSLLILLMPMTVGEF